MIIARLQYKLFIILLIFSINSFSQNKIDYYSYLLDANISLLNQNLDSSVLLLTKAIDLNSNSSASDYLLSEIYYHQSNYLLALNYALNAFNIDTTNYWYKNLLFNIYKSLHDRNNAKHYLNKILSSSTNVNDYYNALNYADSINDSIYFLSSLDQYKNQFGEDEFYFQTKISYYKSINDELSITFALDYYNTYKHSKLSLEVLLDTYNNFFYLDSLDKYNSIFLKLYEPNFLFFLQLSKYYNLKYNISKQHSYIDSSLYYFNFALHSREFSLKPILNFLQNNIEIYNPIVIKSEYDSIANFLEIHVTDSDYLFDYLANTYLNYNRFYDALHYFKLYLSINYSNFTNYFKTFALMNRLQYWTELDSLTNISLNLFPLAPEVYLFRGISLLNLNFLDEAIENINYGIEINYDNEFLICYLKFYKSEYYRLIGDSINSQSYFDEAVELSNNSFDILTNFALYYAKNNICIDKALDLISYCITSNPYDLSPSVSYTYSYILFQINDFANALNYINSAIDNTIYPNFFYFYLKSKILNSSGRINEAKKLLNKSIEYGNFPSKY